MLLLFRSNELLFIGITSVLSVSDLVSVSVMTSCTVVASLDVLCKAVSSTGTLSFTLSLPCVEVGSGRSEGGLRWTVD